METLKKLEELGISPAPWKIDMGSDGWIIVRDAKGMYAATPDGDEETEAIANANFIEAAPAMYDAIWDILFKCTKITNCRNCKGHELGNCGGCPLGKARAALEKAGGAK